MEQYPLIDTGAVLAVAGPHKGLPAIVVDSPENSFRGINSAGADHGLVRTGIIAVFVNTEYGYAALDDINADEIGEAGLCLYIELLVAFKRPELLHEALAPVCKLNLLLTRGKGIAALGVGVGVAVGSGVISSAVGVGSAGVKSGLGEMAGVTDSAGSTETSPAVGKSVPGSSVFGLYVTWIGTGVLSTGFILKQEQNESSINTHKTNENSFRMQGPS